MIFLAGAFARSSLAHDGRVDDSTRALLVPYLNSGWRGIHLGGLSTEYSTTTLYVGDARALDAFVELCNRLRRAQPDLMLGAECGGGHWSEATWKVLCNVLDWVSLSPARLTTFQALLPHASPRELCLELPLDLDTWPEQKKHYEAMLDTCASILDRVHLHHPSTAWAHLVGGSERASAKLVRAARELISGRDLGLMISGRIKHGEDARRVRELVPEAWLGMARGAWAVPEVLEDEKRGRLSAYCTGCMACVDQQSAAHTWCVQRFSSTFIEQLCARPPRALDVIGASFMGMTLALAAADAGVEDVRLWTMGQLPGGMMRLRGRAPRQAEHAESALTRYEQVLAHPGVSVHREALDVEALEAHLLRRESVRVCSLLPEQVCDAGQIDAVSMLRAGSAPAVPAEDAPWVVHGDTLLAAEVALFLRMQWREVWWVGDHLAADTSLAWQRIYKERLPRRGVQILTTQEFAQRELSHTMLNHVEARGKFGRSELAERLMKEVSGVLELRDLYEPNNRRREVLAFEAAWEAQD